MTGGGRFRTALPPIQPLPMRKTPRRSKLVRTLALGVAGVLAVLAVWMGFGWL